MIASRQSAGAAPAWAGAPRILTFTTLFPNSAAPSHGVFVENRLRHLMASGRVSARVVAPVPWFPSSAPVFGRYASFAKAPRQEERFGIAIEHPRYPVLPKFGMNVAPLLLFLAALPVLRRLQASKISISSTRIISIPTASPPCCWAARSASR